MPRYASASCPHLIDWLSQGLEEGLLVNKDTEAAQ